MVRGTGRIDSTGEGTLLMRQRRLLWRPRRRFGWAVFHFQHRFCFPLAIERGMGTATGGLGIPGLPGCLHCAVAGRSTLFLRFGWRLHWTKLRRAG